jgi:tetratricopeptide (TPR) repeat protein/TolB-like protein
MSSGLWSRIRESRLLRVLLIYAGAAWAVLEATDFFIGKFGLPEWFFAAALVLLLIGLVNLVITGWVQARPAAQARGVSGPNPWEIDLVDLKDSVARGRLPQPTWGRAFLGGVVAFSLLFGFAGVYVLLTQQRGPSAAPESTAAGGGLAIAVLPFRVAGPEAGLWREGMVDLFSNNLDGVAGLRAIDPRTVLSRWRSELGEEQEGTDLEHSLQVARDVGAVFALSGSMVGSENAVRLTADVHDLVNGGVERVQVEGSPDSVLALVDRLCVEILRSDVLPAAGELPELDLSRITTSSLPALKAFLQGEQKYRRSRFSEAVAAFSRAVEADTTFAMAFYRISQAYGWVDPFSERTAEYAARALELSDRLPERERLLVQGRARLEQFDPAGIEYLEQFTSRYPDDIDGWNMLADMYYHVGDFVLVPRDEAQGAFLRSMEMDPGFGPTYIHLIDAALVEQDSARARELIARHRAIDPESPHARGLALVEALTWGDSASRAQASSGLASAGADALVTAFARFYWSGNFFPEPAIAVSQVMVEPGMPEAARRLGVVGHTRARLGQGQVRSAREFIATYRAVVEAYGGQTYPEQLAVLWYLNGHSELAPAQRAADAVATDPTPTDRFYIGAFAASQERWGVAESQILAVEGAADSARSAGDDAIATQTISFAKALSGYARLRRGDYDAAAEELKAAASAMPDRTIQHFVRFELGKLYLELGDLDQAERYFKSLQFYTQFEGGVLMTTPSEYYLGVIAESRGDVEQAKLHYARVVRWWANADPELPPLWEQGQRALERLTREPTI